VINIVLMDIYARMVEEVVLRKRILIVGRPEKYIFQDGEVTVVILVVLPHVQTPQIIVISSPIWGNNCCHYTWQGVMCADAASSC
jgi:hypothetical protein